MLNVQSQWAAKPQNTVDLFIGAENRKGITLNVTVGTVSHAQEILIQSYIMVVCKGKKS